MSKGGIFVLLIAALVFAALGFALGQIIQAVSPDPASPDNPLITKEYLEGYVGIKLADMQVKIDELESALYSLGYTGTFGEGGDGSAGLATPADPDDGQTAGTDGGDSTPVTNAVRTVTADADSVRVRQDSNTDATIITTVTRGEVMTYLGQKDESGDIWYRVELSDGTQGWVAGWLCTDPV